MAAESKQIIEKIKLDDLDLEGMDLPEYLYPDMGVNDLFEEGARYSGHTPLSISICYFDFKFIQILLKTANKLNGCDVNLTSCIGTPLSILIEKIGQCDLTTLTALTESLLQKGAKFNVPSKYIGPAIPCDKPLDMYISKYPQLRKILLDSKPISSIPVKLDKMGKVLFSYIIPNNIKTMIQFLTLEHNILSRNLSWLVAEYAVESKDIENITKHAVKGINANNDPNANIDNIILNFARLALLCQFEKEANNNFPQQPDNGNNVNNGAQQPTDSTILIQNLMETVAKQGQILEAQSNKLELQTKQIDTLTYQLELLSKKNEQLENQMSKMENAFNSLPNTSTNTSESLNPSKPKVVLFSIDTQNKPNGTNGTANNTGTKPESLTQII